MDPYKLKSVKVELSNKAAHTLMNVDLTDQWNKSEIDGEKIDEKILSLNHLNENKLIRRREDSEVLFWTDLNQSEQNTTECLISLHELLTLEHIQAELPKL